MDPSKTILNIPIELDQADWQLEFDQSDIQVYSKHDASDSGIIGFKTITYHAVSIHSVLDLLKDVCDAMNNINDMFVLGEVFRKWPTDFDKEGTLVRTSFKMPFPFKNREFLHGLHYQQINATSHVFGYTPIEDQSIPLQDAYIRCEMFISGQRVSQLSDGLVKVEHLMVYRLGGKVSSYLQDKWLKKSHVKAYIKEWRNLRSFLFPPDLENVAYKNLVALGSSSFIESENWSKQGKGKYGKVRSGRLAYAPHVAYRLDLEVEARLELAVDILADRSLEFLQKWNKEFISGEILQTKTINANTSNWLLKVSYKTPNPLDNREYVYFFSREWISSDEAIICYNSVKYSEPSANGFTRALLYPSFHRCLRTAHNKTKVEHILATDLGGNLATFQDNLLSGSLASAQYSDMEKQVALFDSLQNAQL
jgi:hypothetical protein